MAALREDIKLHFPIQLENPHVIGYEIYVSLLRSFCDYNNSISPLVST